MNKLLVALFISYSAALPVSAQSNTEKLSPLDFVKGKDPLVDAVLANSERYRFQWIFTPLTQDSSGRFYPKQTYDYSTNQYFYPASMVKLPTAILTLEKLTEKAVSLNAVLKINADQICGNMDFMERTQRSSISFETMIEEMISISDNSYYTSLYHFLTPSVIYDKLTARGLTATKIYKGFSGCELPENLFCNSLSYFDPTTKIVHTQEYAQLELSSMAARYNYSSDKLLGSKHEYRNAIVNGPFDFNYNLEFPLAEIHGTMERLIYPLEFEQYERWNLTHNDRAFLLKTLVQYPREMKNSRYHDLKKYPDNYYKYIVHGDGNTMYSGVKTYSKIGISYGFVTETALVVDETNGKAYLLSASIYVNANDTVNDGKYEYEEIARPFFAKLGQLLLDF